MKELHWMVRCVLAWKRKRYQMATIWFQTHRTRWPSVDGSDI